MLAGFSFRPIPRPRYATLTLTVVFISADSIVLKSPCSPTPFASISAPEQFTANPSLIFWGRLDMYMVSHFIRLSRKSSTLSNSLNTPGLWISAVSASTTVNVSISCAPACTKAQKMMQIIVNAFLTSSIILTRRRFLFLSPQSYKIGIQSAKSHKTYFVSGGNPCVLCIDFLSVKSAFPRTKQAKIQLVRKYPPFSGQTYWVLLSN